MYWRVWELYSAVLMVWSLTKYFNKAIIPLGDWENINKAGYILYDLYRIWEGGG
jgi:hypothetical protein